MTVTRRHLIAAGLAGLATLPVARPAGAVIVLDRTWRSEGGAPGRESEGFRAHEALANQSQFAPVIALSTDGGEEWGVGSATWLGNFGGHAWLLSASHLFKRNDSVFDYTFRAPDGTPCSGDRQIRHPLFNGNYDETTGYDVVLLRMSGPMDGGGPPPLLYGGTHEEGAQVVMVGFGSRGIGSAGQDDAYEGPSGSKAAATNVVDEVEDLVEPPPHTGERGNWLSVTLRHENEGAGRLDGLLGSGDSGGSLWMRTQSGWAVIGVNAAGGERYGDSSYFARVSGLRPWLSSYLRGLRFVG
jgi:hypothetical protein